MPATSFNLEWSAGYITCQADHLILETVNYEVKDEIQDLDRTSIISNMP
jgi:hypothetical protein